MQYVFTCDENNVRSFLLGILDKNRDTFSADLHQVIAQSYCKFLLHLFEKELKMVSSFLNECICCVFTQ